MYDNSLNYLFVKFINCERTGNFKGQAEKYMFIRIDEKAGSNVICSHHQDRFTFEDHSLSILSVVWSY